MSGGPDAGRPPPGRLGRPPSGAVPPEAEALAPLPVAALRVREEACFLKLDAGDRTLRLDREGRWLTARLGATFLRRLVDGSVFATSDLVHLSDYASDSPWHQTVRVMARAFADGLAAGAATEPVPMDADRERWSLWLDRVQGWTSDRYAEQESLFHRTYPEPVPILPPDRYRDLVVLPAVGCPHGRCTFCAWYQDAGFEVARPDDFERHLDGVAELFGAAVGVRSGLFLGSASAFSVADRQLVPAVERCRERFGIFERGVAGFLDPDHAPRRTTADWRTLAGLGVRRVVVGLETGSTRIREGLGKSADLAAMEQTVEALAGSGISAGVSVLAGLGAAADEAEHHRETVACIERLGLGPADLVYVSPLRGARDPEAAADAARELTAALRALGGPRVSPYRLELYRYFA